MPSFSISPGGVHTKNVTAVLGPTNTGKTHLAVERMVAHETGMIGLPLRLLAREVYDRVCLLVGKENVALITGEEKIKPPEPRFYVCTVEAMPVDLRVDFLAIDEVQLAADPDRGHVFTDRILYARGYSETMLLGAMTVRNALQSLLPGIQIVTRPRFSSLVYSGRKKITRMPPKTAIVAFSTHEVYAIAELMRRQRGGSAVVLGALSPRTRNAQVELYQSGDVEFMIATDAIGMGLNLDIEHVAFSDVVKFDGQQHRHLTAGEMGQIAGRAGRHTNDGTFGVTGNVDELPEELIEQLEEHEFDQLFQLQWRNSHLDFDNIESLLNSLNAPPELPRLVKARFSSDYLALESVTREKSVQKRINSTEDVIRLWDTCQIPDYRKISPTDHAELVEQVFEFLSEGHGHLPVDWMAAQVAEADRVDGNIDTLSNRISLIRTWTFIANRGDWLEDPVYWQERTKEIENNLSDALHEKLTQRFVDRRTSVLMQRLRDNEELYAEVQTTGEVFVENHFVGNIEGFRFKPDSHLKTTQGKAARYAASIALKQEMTSRAEQLTSSPPEDFSLTSTGAIKWKEEVVGRLKKGNTPLEPVIDLFSDDNLSAEDKTSVVERLKVWLQFHMENRIKPLLEISKSEEITGLGKGIAFQLAENLGSLKRGAVAKDIQQLDQPARAELRKFGVRFGAFNIFFPLLLKPAPSELIYLLHNIFHLENDQSASGGDSYPEPPRAGLTSVEATSELTEKAYRASGYQLLKDRAVRIDMLERLGDMIRPLLVYENSATLPLPEGATGKGSFHIQPDMLSIIGCSHVELETILELLGYQKLRVKKDLPKEDSEVEIAFTQAAMKTLGEWVNIADLTYPPEKVEIPEEDKYENVWRIKRRNPPANKNKKYSKSGSSKGDGKSYQGKKDGHKKFDRDRGKGKGKGNFKGDNNRPKPRNKPLDPDSPFAALGQLKKGLKKK